MKRLLILSVLPALALVAACGHGTQGAGGNIVTTNTGDVVLNDSQDNYAFAGDNETAANDTLPDTNMTGGNMQ